MISSVLETVGICSRYNYAIEKSRLKRRNNDVTDDADDDVDDVMTFSCDEAGGFERVQCFRDECWCVRPNGEEMTSSRVRVASGEDSDEVDINCGESTLKIVNCIK